MHLLSRIDDSLRFHLHIDICLQRVNNQIFSTFISFAILPTLSLLFTREKTFKLSPYAHRAYQVVIGVIGVELHPYGFCSQQEIMILQNKIKPKRPDEEFFNSLNIILLTSVKSYTELIKTSAFPIKVYEKYK